MACLYFCILPFALLFVTLGVSALDTEFTTVLEFQSAVVTLGTDLKGIIGGRVAFIVSDGMNTRQLGLDGNTDLFSTFWNIQHTFVPEEAFDHIRDLRIEGVNILPVFKISAVGIINTAQLLQNELSIAGTTEDRRDQSCQHRVLGGVSQVFGIDKDLDRPFAAVFHNISQGDIDIELNERTFDLIDFGINHVRPLKGQGLCLFFLIFLFGTFFSNAVFFTVI